jgi:hypothetical protein
MDPCHACGTTESASWMLVSPDSPYTDARLALRLDPGVYCAACSAGTFREAAVLAADGAFGPETGTDRK